MLDLSHRLELEGLSGLVEDMNLAIPDAEPLLVGALARDVLLHYAHGIAIQRRTTDADFAIVVSGWPEFAKVRERLLASGRFCARDGATHALTHCGFGRVDLIPFGSVEAKDASIAWPPAGDEVMSVLAYAEAKAAAVDVTLPRMRHVLVVSLPMLAVLKALAWKERRVVKPRSDSADLALMLRNYAATGNTERIAERYPETEDFDLEMAGAWLLGRDARDQLQKTSSRFDVLMLRLDEVLVPEIDPSGKLNLAADIGGQDVERALGLLTAFHRGLKGERS